MERNKEPDNLWNKIRLRHKILIIIIILSFVLIWSFPWIILLDTIYVIGYMHGLLNSCPKCKSFNVKQKIKTELLNSENSFKTVSRSVNHKDAQGNIIGSSTYKETIPIKLHTVKNHYKCKKCGHYWEGRKKFIEEGY